MSPPHSRSPWLCRKNTCGVVSLTVNNTHIDIRVILNRVGAVRSNPLVKRTKGDSLAEKLCRKSRVPKKKKIRVNFPWKEGRGEYVSNEGEII